MISVTLRRWLIRVGEWLLLFVGLLLAIWAATQRRDAPELTLLLLLLVIVINFSLPTTRGAIGLVPVVATTSLLVVGLEAAIFLTIAGHIVAELARPLWAPIWEPIRLAQSSIWHRLGTTLTHVTALAIGGLAVLWIGGQLPPDNYGAKTVSHFVVMAVVYGAVHVGLTIGQWVVAGWSVRALLRDHLLFLTLATIVVQPVALLGGLTHANGGPAVFVTYCTGIFAASSLVWLSWQRRYVLEQQLSQFGSLNSAGTSLRETLELPEVLRRTHDQVIQLVPVDSFAIVLLQEQQYWRHSYDGKTGPTPSSQTLTRAELIQGRIAPDDYTRWVAENRRVLYLNRRNMHYATRHNLQPPEPVPQIWLGIPLTTTEETIGVMVLEQYRSYQPYSRWSREVLLAIAGQASAAIQNARLYSETLRLYNQTDAALARRVEQLQALLNSMQEGVLMLDTAGQIVLINPMAAALLGNAVDNLQMTRLEPDDASCLGYEAASFDTLLNQLASGALPESRLTTFQNLGSAAEASMAGEYRFVERIESPVLAENGQVMGWLMLFRDVTAAQELAERRADVLRMIVHDLRNPVTTLMSTLNLVESLLPAPAAAMPDSVADLLANAQRGCVDMLDMVDSLLDINRIEAGQFTIQAEATDLGSLVRHVIRRLRPLAQHRQVSLSCDEEEALPPIWGDEDMVRRIVVNLLDNALKFTPAGGEVLCRLQAEPDVLGRRDPGVRCTVHDSGPGISPEFKEQIFNRFVRTNQGGATIRGTGLGLAYCKLAIEAHEGKIWVESDASGGSRFTFTLPGIPRPESTIAILSES